MNLYKKSSHRINLRSKSILILALISVFLSTNWVWADSWKGPILWTAASGSNSSGIIFADAPDAGDAPGLHSWFGDPNTYCKRIEDCAKANQKFYKAYAPICELVDSRNCIEDFWIKLNGQTFHPAFETYAPKNPIYEFEGNSVINLPSGKAPSIWKLDDPKFAAVPAYFAINATFRGVTFAGDPIFQAPQINVSIDQIQKISGTFGELIDSRLVYDCAAADTNYCAARIDSAPEIRFGIKMRITMTSSPWIFGRLYDPTFEVSGIGPSTKWSIEAAPIKVPATSGKISNSLITSALPDGYRQPWGIQYLSNGYEVFALFDKLIGKTNNKSSFIQNRWNFTASRDDLYRKYPWCSSNGPIGLITTNANVYQGSPPIFNGKNSTLNYQIASSHLDPDGKEFVGFYQLKMDTRFAKCLYDFGAGLLKAEISVVSDTGQSKVATTSFQASDKWLTFTAANFTFSKPTIKVKLFEVASPVEKSKLITITCIKGKVLKKVSGISPKCPSGYKRK